MPGASIVSSRASAASLPDLCSRGTKWLPKKSMSVAMRAGSTAENAEDFAEVGEKHTLCVALRELLQPLSLGFVLLSLTFLMACQPASSRTEQPLSAGSLVEEYERSNASVRSKYDGKEIIVRGYTPTAATLPHEGHEQGSVWLEEKGGNTSRQVACWFSRDQADQFSKIRGTQYITVKGVFNGEAGADLKFCRLVKIE